MKDRNGSTSFLLLNKKGGLFKNVSLKKYLWKSKQKIYMTKSNWEIKFK